MGLMQVKGLSGDTAEEIVEARGRQPFRHLADFWRRTSVDRDVVQNLVAVGAFDALGIPRRQLLWQLDEIVRRVERVQRATFNVQRATFRVEETRDPRSRAPEGSQNPKPRNLELGTRMGVCNTSLQEPGTSSVERLPALPPLTELDLAGLDFTLQDVSARYSIMSFYRRSLRAMKVRSIGDLEQLPHGLVVKTAGIVISRQRPPTAKGMTFLVLSDEEGELPVAVYPNVYERDRRTLHSSASLVIEGTIQRTRRSISLMAKRLWRLQDVAQLDTRPYPYPSPERQVVDIA